MKLSATLIVRDESEFIDACLASLRAPARRRRTILDFATPRVRSTSEIGTKRTCRRSRCMSAIEG